MARTGHNPKDLKSVRELVNRNDSLASAVHSKTSVKLERTGHNSVKVVVARARPGQTTTYCLLRTRTQNRLYA